MNNGLTVYIYNLYNTKYYCVMLETKDGTTTVIGEKQTLGEYIYNDFSKKDCARKVLRFWDKSVDEGAHPPCGVQSGPLHWRKKSAHLPANRAFVGVNIFHFSDCFCKFWQKEFFL